MDDVCHHFCDDTEEDRQLSAWYDKMLAEYLIFNQCWKQHTEAQSFRYEVDGRNLTNRGA